jgi:H+/gluconate symporter-like permease
MDLATIIIGMIIALILVMFGYILGAENTRSHEKKLHKAKPVEKDDDDPADWWRKGKSPYQEDDDE